MTLAPGHYSEFPQLFSAKTKLNQKELTALQTNLLQLESLVPAGAPILVLGGSGDYSLAPHYNDNPSEFLKQWAALRPDRPLRFSTLSAYFDALMPGIESGKIKVPTLRGETPYFYTAFWIENPNVKSWYRRDEHGLQGAEALSTIASLQAGYVYPAQDIDHAWILMCLNMDRNTLWGSAGGMVFEHDTSWDARDRFQWVEANNAKTFTAAGQNLLGSGDGVALFNAANWERKDPVTIQLPVGKSLEGVACEQASDGKSTICRPVMPSVGTATFKLSDTPAAPPAKNRSAGANRKRLLRGQDRSGDGRADQPQAQALRARDAGRTGQ